MKISVTKPHISNYPDPVSFEKGERLLLGVRDNEYIGWIWVKTSNGKTGWAPEQIIQLLSDTEGIALESYSALELNTVENEELLVLRELNAWLWVQDTSGDLGWVPRDSTDACNAK